MDKVPVELIPDPELGGFTARVPDIPAYGEGETEEEAIADLKQALRGYIEGNAGTGSVPGLPPSRHVLQSS